MTSCYKLARPVCRAIQRLVTDCYKATLSATLLVLVVFAAGCGGSDEELREVVLVAHELGPLEPLITRAVVVHHGTVAHDGAVPAPAGHHAHPDHDHVHPHGPDDRPTGMWAS